MHPQAMDTAYCFVNSMTKDFINRYSREMFLLLKKQDPLFRHYGAEALHLRKDDCDEVDRFVFLFLCKKILEARDNGLALCIYSLRQNGLRLAVSEEKGICICPEKKWFPIPDESMECFKTAWLCIPREKRNWIRGVFEKMPEDFPDIQSAMQKDSVAA